MIIDCHAHLVPPDLLIAIRKEKSRFPSVRLIEEGDSLAFAFAGGKPTRAVSKGLTDVAGRIAWMDKQGIDKQVISSWLDLFGYEMPIAEAEPWSKMLNDAQMALTKSQPRFVPLATVPMQDGAKAAAALKAAMAAGFPGAMIGTLPRGVGSVLDSKDLDPFWKAADETGAVIQIHPSFDAGDRRVDDFGLANGVGRISDAIVAVARLLASGHLTRYSNAKVLVPMGAAAIPFVLGRLKKNTQITPGNADPVEGLAHLYTDTILHDPRALKFTIEIMGADRIMLGSDMPFPIGDSEPKKIVDAAGLKPDQVASINGGLAKRLFRIQ